MEWVLFTLTGRLSLSKNSVTLPFSSSDSCISKSWALFFLKGTEEAHAEKFFLSLFSTSDNSSSNRCGLVDSVCDITKALVDWRWRRNRREKGLAVEKGCGQAKGWWG